MMEILSEEDREFIRETADKYIAKEKVMYNKFFHSRNGFVLSFVLIGFYLTKSQDHSTLIISLLSTFSLFMSLLLFKNYMFLKQARWEVWAWATPFDEQMRQFHKWLRKQEEKELRK